ncbi:MAG: hypothetical protein H0U71_08815 [Gammaproteobacteria bacterium]|nr:hypothetical protein [Gammaproteobacteria bacterium]
MIKKITLGLTALLSTVSINALASSNKAPFDVTVPSYNGGFTFGLAGLYLRPSVDALDYGIVYPAPAEVSATGQLRNGSVQNVDPDYDWGYRANIGYVFPSSANDVSLSYTNYKNTQTDAVKLKANEVFIATTAPFLVDATSVATFGSDAKFTTEYQAVDLDFGQHFNIGCNTHIKFLTGLRYVDLRNTFNANYEGTLQLDDDAAAETFNINTSQKSSFKGIGPRLGMDAEYSLGRGFGVVSQATTALLVGNSKSKFEQHATLTNDTLTITDVASFENPKITRVVPNLNAKLGLNYNVEFCNPSHTKMTVEAGYQVDHFFNSVDRLNGLGLSGAPRVITDTNFAGPYVGVQVRI